MYTTLNKIKEYSPCKDGYRKLLSYLNKTTADDKPLSLLTILKSNGIEDALWCLRAVDGYEREKRLLAVKYARRVQHLMTDHRSINAVNTAERYANGEATVEELQKAHDAAWAAARADAAYAAYAAWAAARADAWTAWAAVRAAVTKELKYQRGEFIKMVNSVSSN